MTSPIFRELQVIAFVFVRVMQARGDYNPVWIFPTLRRKTTYKEKIPFSEFSTFST